ncbi:MAG TPA: peptidoglycan DD-metalloendopeptidase family protein [Casimicrobiaceae bacterium]|nr:peptidoglycan DD-metalloendopeptidase family protein [Casimicrobiaceae bacterium]
MKTLRYVRTAARLVAIGLVVVVAGCSTRSVAPVEDRGRALSQSPPPSTVASVPPPLATPAPAPVPPRRAEADWRPSTYTVKRGDTLQTIALEHGLDYRELAAWNALDNPNLILVGQVLRLSPPGEGSPANIAGATSTGVTTAPLKTVPPVVESRAAPPMETRPVVRPAPLPAAPETIARNTESLKVSPKAIKERYTPERARELAKVESEPIVIARADATKAAPASPPPVSTPAPATVPTKPPASATPPAASSPPVVATAPSTAGAARPSNDDGDDLDWIWPAKGKLVTGFSDTANLKGIDIAGSSGQTIVASAPGRVVYAGSGLRGYGKLVIIKHNNTYLSAYAHNREIVVKEGQQVKRGEKIAEMGNTDAEQVKLHFEIRRLGRPMDPIKFLPPA